MSAQIRSHLANPLAGAQPRVHGLQQRPCCIQPVQDGHSFVSRRPLRSLHPRHLMDRYDFQPFSLQLFRPLLGRRLIWSPCRLSSSLCRAKPQEGSSEIRSAVSWPSALGLLAWAAFAGRCAALLSAVIPNTEPYLTGPCCRVCILLVTKSDTNTGHVLLEKALWTCWQ